MQALYIPCTVHGHARDFASEVALFAARQMVFSFFTPFKIGSDTCSHWRSSVHSLAKGVIKSGGRKGIKGDGRFDRLARGEV